MANQELKKPGPYDVVDPNYRGTDPNDPFRCRDRKNARRTNPRQMQGRVDDTDHFGVGD